MNRSDPVLWLYCALNLAVVFVWLLVAIEASSVRLALADYGVPIGALTLFFAIPLGLFAAFWIERRRVESRPTGVRVYFIVSRLFLGLSWIPACFPILFIVAILQPWPLTLREGPDTDYARGHFRRFAGYEAPQTVEGLYYRVEGARDATTFMRFTCHDRAVVEHIAERLYLEPFETDGAILVPDDWKPAWWPPDEVRAGERWSRGEGWTSLWYVEDQGLVLYRSLTF